MNYFHIKIYDYKYNRDYKEKGILLDEFFQRGKSLTKEKVKEALFQVSMQEPYILKYQKPRKNKDGVYAIITRSSEYWYNYFYERIDTYCFYCHKKIQGPMKEFPSIKINNKIYYFCKYDCKSKMYSKINYEGKYQTKFVPDSIIGYIYHIYNRKEDKHYIGQSKYMPFFRWQEHVKSHLKGDIMDLTFEVITEVREQKGIDNQELLNNVEAWWIKKFKQEGYDILNEQIPKFTLKEYEENFKKMLLLKNKLNTKN